MCWNFEHLLAMLLRNDSDKNAVFTQSIEELIIFVQELIWLQSLILCPIIDDNTKSRMEQHNHFITVLEKNISSN